MLLRLSESRRPSLIKPPLIIFQYAPARWSAEVGDWPRRMDEEESGGGGGEDTAGKAEGGRRRIEGG